MKKPSKIIMIIVLVVIVFLGIYTAIYCTVGSYKAVHTPRQSLLKTPVDYGLEYQNIEFTTSDDLKLKGWWIPNQSKSTIVVIHGYGANRAGWKGKDTKGQEEYIDWMAGAVPLYRAGYSLLLFDLRACGESEGEMVTLGYHEEKDVEAAIEWLLENDHKTDYAPTEHIGLLGFSMGGNVALRGGRIVKKLIEEGQIKSAAVVAVGPTIYSTMIDKSLSYWAGGMPTPFFMPALFKKAVSYRLGFDVTKELDPARYVSQISPVPVMYIQAEKDEIGDVSDVTAMFKASKEPKDIIIIPDALRFEHYKYPAEHPERVIEFFDQYLDDKSEKRT